VKLALAAVVLLTATPALAFAGDGADLVYVEPGATQQVAIPFAIGGARPSDPKIARVAIDGPHRAIDVTGVAEGKTIVTVTETRHAKHAYTIYVIVTTHVHVTP
jgi:hypothetical protein